MTRRLGIRDDSGASLLMVLVLITVLALGVTVLLSFTTTSERTTIGLRDQASTAYNADGALQAAINTIRNSTYNNSAGQHCFGGSDTLLLNNFNGSDSAAVTCVPDPAKVLIHCPSLSNCNRPGNAILTLGRITGEDGLHVDQPNTGSSLRVHGLVFANSNINVVNGKMETNTAVFARTTCAGTIVSTPAPQCNYGNVANPFGDDPNYAPDIASAPGYRALPACTTQNSVVTFEPGYYDDAKGLSDMMAGNSACRHSTWWFKPGSYYFDFHNSGPNANSVLPGAANVWTVDDGYLVAGTPVNAAGGVLAQPPVPAAIPGSCQNPINDAGAKGVQFIFGGDSQFAVKSGQVEICGTYSAAKPPLALYGLKSGSETTTTANGLAAGSVAAADFAGATPVNQGALENTYAPNTFASWAGDPKGGGSITGQVSLSGYPVTIPAGANLLSAKLRVGHRYTPNSNGNITEALSIVVTPSSGAPFTRTVPSGVSGVGQVDTIDIGAALAPAVHASGLSSISFTYKATVKQKGTEDLDGVALDLSYIVPAFRAGSGCVTTGPYTGVGNASRCALVTTVNNNGNQFYVQGTTYAPNAALDITLNNVAEQVFRFGVIARSLWVKLTGSFSFAGPVIEVPDDSPGFVFSVYLSAYVCPRAASCAPSGTPLLRSKIAYVDADPVNPQKGNRQVVVLSWTTSR